MALYSLGNTDVSGGGALELNIEIAEIDTLRGEVNVHETRLDALEAGGGGGGGGVTLPIAISDVTGLQSALNDSVTRSYLDEYSLRFSDYDTIFSVGTGGDFATLSAALSHIETRTIDKPTNSTNTVKPYYNVILNILSNITEPSTLETSIPGINLKINGNNYNITTSKYIIIKNAFSVLINNMTFINTADLTPSATTSRTYDVDHMKLDNRSSPLVLDNVSNATLNNITVTGGHFGIILDKTKAYLEGSLTISQCQNAIFAINGSSVKSSATINLTASALTSSNSGTNLCGGICLKASVFIQLDNNITINNFYQGVYNVGESVFSVEYCTINMTNIRDSGIYVDANSTLYLKPKDTENNQITMRNIPSPDGESNFGIQSYAGSSAYVFRTQINTAYTPYCIGAVSQLIFYDNISDINTRGYYSVRRSSISDYTVASGQTMAKPVLTV